MRVNNLITELLDLVRPKEPHFAYGDPHDLIEKTVKTCTKKIPLPRRLL
jgi:hypothetical protein